MQTMHGLFILVYSTNNTWTIRFISSDYNFKGRESSPIWIIHWKLLTFHWDVICVSPCESGHAKNDIIYAWIVHRLVVNRWIMYHKILIIGQKRFLSIESEDKIVMNNYQRTCQASFQAIFSRRIYLYECCKKTFFLDLISLPVPDKNAGKRTKLFGISNIVMGNMDKEMSWKRYRARKYTVWLSSECA